MLQENVVVGEGTPYPLNGILTLPAEASSLVPAVVFVHGSGSSDMDERVGKLTPFKDLAEGLARRGIASLRYDKRSFAHGLKMLRDKTLTITVKEETIDDALLATEILKGDPRIDPGAVFIVGHSMGAMLAPRIDAEGGDFRGLVLMAGTPRKMEEVLIEQGEEALSQMGALSRLLARGSIRKTAEMFTGLYELSDEEAKRRKAGGGTTLYYFKEMGRHDVPTYLAASDKPMLIMQGEDDFQVKADRDFAAYQELLAGRPNVAFKLYEGLNHAFVASVGASIAQAKREFAVERHIGDEVIDDIANWIKSTVI